MNNSQIFTTGLIQISMEDSSEKNLQKAIDFIYKAAKNGAQVICLPELFRSKYFCQKEDISLFDLAETIPGPSTEAIGKIAKELKVVVILPLFEKRAVGLYHNSVAVIDADGKLLGKYRKMHIPDDPGFYEKFYFTPGDLGFKCFDSKYGKLGTLICWDQWFPEGARITALKGAAILFYPTAIGWHPYEKEEQGGYQFESWITIQRSHSIANGVYTASVNRVGIEKETPESAGIEFWGASFISDPQGIILAKASHDKEEIILADIDLGRIEYIRRNWPFLRDRRVDYYNDIEKRFLDND